MMGERKKFLLGSLLLVLLAVALSAGWFLLHKREPGSFGAVAVSADAMSYGTAWGYRDQADAYQRSVSECERQGGHDCSVRISLNGTCGALVSSGERQASYLTSDTDKYQAGALGLATCQASGAGDCVVREQFCGNGG